MRFGVICETDGCPSRGSVINVVLVPDDLAQTWAEGYGAGSEDDADYCCGGCEQLGVVYEWDDQEGTDSHLEADYEDAQTGGAD